MSICTRLLLIGPLKLAVSLALFDATSCGAPDNLKGNLDTLYASSKDRLNDALVDINDRWQGTEEAINNAVNNAVEKITNTEATYKEHMKLNASVTYWEEKESEHKDKRKSQRTLLLVYTTMVLAVIIAALFCGLPWGLAQIKGISTASAPSLASAGYVLIASAVLITATVMFWIGRVLSRLYLSERHLEADARERSTMVKTYLALTKEDVLSEVERPFVLQALFRNSTDGIVKEDPGPGISLAGLIARQADNK